MNEKEKGSKEERKNGKIRERKEERKNGRIGKHRICFHFILRSMCIFITSCLHFPYHFGEH